MRGARARSALAHGAPSFSLRDTFLSGHDAPVFGFQGLARLNEGRMMACVRLSFLFFPLA